MSKLSQKDRKEAEEMVAAAKKYWPIVKAMIKVQNDTGDTDPEVLSPDDLDWVLDVDYMLDSGLTELLDRVTPIAKALRVDESKDFFVNIVIFITALRKQGIFYFNPQQEEKKMSSLRGEPKIPEVPDNYRLVKMGEEIKKGDLFFDGSTLCWDKVSPALVGVVIGETSALIARVDSKSAAEELADILMEELGKHR